jgi:hypothetical protein
VGVPAWRCCCRSPLGGLVAHLLDVDRWDSFLCLLLVKMALGLSGGCTCSSAPEVVFPLRGLWCVHESQVQHACRLAFACFRFVYVMACNTCSGGCHPLCVACSVPDCTFAGCCHACSCVADVPVFGMRCAKDLRLAPRVM